MYKTMQDLQYINRDNLSMINNPINTTFSTNSLYNIYLLHTVVYDQLRMTHDRMILMTNAGDNEGTLTLKTIQS